MHVTETCSSWRERRGLGVGAGCPKDQVVSWGLESVPLLRASAGVCRETVSVMLDGDWVIGGTTVAASPWLSLQELRAAPQ